MSEVRIVRRPDVRGGSATIEGTRISVTDIARIYRTSLPALVAWCDGPPDPKRGFQISLRTVIDAIRAELPQLTEPQVASALAYWHNHEDEIGRDLAEEDIAAIEARQRYSRLP